MSQSPSLSGMLLPPRNGLKYLIGSQPVRWAACVFEFVTVAQVAVFIVHLCVPDNTQKPSTDKGLSSFCVIAHILTHLNLAFGFMAIFWGICKDYGNVHCGLPVYMCSLRIALLSICK